MLTRNRPEGERFWASERRVHYNDLHFHNYYELELVLEGTARHTVNATALSLAPGMLTLLSPRDFHSMEAPHGETVTYYTLGVCPEELSGGMRAILDTLPLPLLLRPTEAQFERLVGMMRELTDAMHTTHPYRIPVVQRRIELLLLTVAGYAAESPSLLTEHAAVPEWAHEMYSVKQYIDEHYAEPIGRAALAASVHYSPSYFSTRFAEVMGVSLSDYLTEVRLTHAFRLLEEGVTVKDAVKAVGFRSSLVFYRAFAKRYGCSPTAYFANNDSQKNQQN